MTDEPGRATPDASRGQLATNDVAALLGISRQRVGQLVATDPTFPSSGGWRHGGRLWHRAGIEVWAAEFRPGRVDPNPMAGVILGLVHHARLESARVRWFLVDTPFFWLGFWDAVVDRRVADVLETLGVSRDDIVRTLQLQFVTRGRPLPPTMSPRVQMELEATLRRARVHGRTEPSEFDVAIALVDAELRGIANARPPSTDWFGGRQGDPILMALEARALDPVELRERLALVEVSPRSMETFPRLSLKPMRRRRGTARPRPPWLPELAKNPLGHDPWAMGGFGSVFFMTPDDRMYKVDGYQWFFYIDADGYPVRTLDGRPVGYRWQMDPPAKDPVRDFEVLPMPPDPVANWPDYEDPSRRRP